MNKESNGTKYLIKNIGFLTISQFGTKILSFFLVPLYTSILSTEDYGTYDLVYSTVSILIPLLTINIFDAVLRFSIDEVSDRDKIFSIAIKYFFAGNAIIFVSLTINHFFTVFKSIDDYAFYFFMMFFVQSLLGIFTAFARGLDRVLDLSVSGVICSIVIITSNILFLCVLKIGLRGYFLANIIGPFLQIVFLFFKIKAWKYINFVSSSTDFEKKMIAYSAPMIANTIAWWVNSVSDRYVVVLFCGLGVMGVYSVASKIPSILNIFQTIFNQAWTLSAVKDFDPNDENGFFTRMYNSYNVLMIILCSILIMMSKLLAVILYKGDFYSAWKYVPFLLISIVFGALSGYIGGIFTAVKNTKIFAKSTVIGAITNLILNIILVPVIGALGAAIATAISYWIVFFMRCKYMKQYINLKINYVRDYISYGLLILQSLALLLLKDEFQLYLIESILFLILIILYYKELKIISNKLLRRKYHE